jgi:hypothetical protein
VRHNQETRALPTKASMPAWGWSEKADSATRLRTLLTTVQPYNLKDEGKLKASLPFSPFLLTFVFLLSFFLFFLFFFSLSFVGVC